MAQSGGLSRGSIVSGDSAYDLAGMTSSTPTTDAGPATSAAARSFTRAPGGGLAVDAGLLGALTVVIGLVYFLTGAPLYNPGESVDPWLYTALWTNFHQMYHHFITTYYASRVPWIAPGYALNAVLGYRAAYFVLHIVFFFGGALLIYVFCRRWLGRCAALLAYAALIANPLYWGMQRWDYVTGGVLTFMIATVAFLAPRTTSNRWRLWSLGLSGFFAAAMIATRLFESLYLLLGVPLLYWATVPRGGRRELVRRIGADAGAFAAGVVVLLVVGGAFAWANGGDFFFLKPQIDVALTNTGGYNKQPVHLWLPLEPYFFVAPFVGGLGWLTLLLARPQRPNTRRVLAASATWCLLQFAVFALWEFAGTGWIFAYSFYWSSFLPVTVICLAATATALIQSGAARSRYRLLTVALGTTAVVVPLAWIYGADSLRWVANGIGHGTYLATLIVMAVALVLVGVWRIVGVPSLVVAATVTALFAFALGTSTSAGTFQYAAHDPTSGDAYTLGHELIEHLQALGYRAPDQVPYFWINDADPAAPQGWLQSLYFFEYTQIGLAMPTVDKAVRQNMSLFKPSRLILLCPDGLTCYRAVRALATAGYPSLLRSAASYRSGRLELVIVELALPQFGG
jgi:hypothetical protein